MKTFGNKKNLKQGNRGVCRELYSISELEAVAKFEANVIGNVMQ